MDTSIRSREGDPEQLLFLSDLEMFLTMVARNTHARSHENIKLLPYLVHELIVGFSEIKFCRKFVIFGVNMLSSREQTTVITG